VVSADPYPPPQSGQSIVVEIPSTGTAIIIVVAFLLPGFVTLSLQEVTFRTPNEPTGLDRLLRIVVYSGWSYVLAAVYAIVEGINRTHIVDLYHRYSNDPAELIWRAALAILIPSLIIVAATYLWSQTGLRAWVMSKLRMNVRHTEPSAWDFFFRQRRHAHVHIKFSDGRHVAGYYGPDSFAAYAKDGRDLFLQEGYEWDEEQNWFGEKVQESCGLWINTSDAVVVTFYNPGQHGQAASEANTATVGPGEAGRSQPAEDSGPEEPGHAAAAQEEPRNPQEGGVGDDGG